MPHALDSQTLTPYRLLPAVLTSPGGTVLLRGFGILEASGEGYELTLTDALGGLFAQVGSRSLRALDLSAYDHPYSLAATQAGQDRTQGYTYALADDGRLTQRDPAQGILWYELTQAVYYRAVLAAIVAAALPGYRLSGSLLTDPTFAAAVFPRATAAPRLREALRAPYAVQALRELPVREHDNGSGKYYPLIAFPRLLSGNAFFFDGTRLTTPPFPADLRVSARLLVRADAEFVAYGGPTTNTVAAVRIVDATDAAAVSVHEQVILEGSGLYFQVLVDKQPPGFRAVEFDFTLPATAARRQLAVQLRLENGAGLTIGPGSFIRFAVAERVYPGAPVHLETSLPDLSQADALKLLCNQFNVVMQADAEARTVRFDLFNDLEGHRNVAVDWSAKVDTSQRPRLAYRLGDYAQRNTFAYENAPKDYNDLLLGAPAALAPGLGVLPVANATLPATAEAYAAPVALPLPHPALAGALSLAWLPFVADADPTNPPTRYDAAQGYAAGKRVVFGGRLWRRVLPSAFGSAPAAPAWAAEDYTSLNEELPTCAVLVPAPAAPGLLVRADGPDATAFAPARALSRTGFPFDALLSAYHEGLRRALSRARLLTLGLRLNAADVAGLDFTVPVRLSIAHIAGYGALRGLFYLNDIDQYQPGRPGPVNVTLLALGDQVPGLAPAVTVPLAPPAGTRRTALLLESGAPLRTEAGAPIFLES